MRRAYTLKDIAPAVAATELDNDGEVWLLNLEHVESHTGRLLEKKMVPTSAVGSSTHAFDAGNVLYSKLRPYLNKVYLPEEYGCCTSEFVPLRPHIELVTREYLAAYLRSERFLSWIRNQVAGAKMPRVSMKAFWGHSIELPSLAEQSHITRILNKVESARHKRLQAIHEADKFLRAVFLEMFGDSVTNSMGWDDTAYLESVADVISGVTKGRKLGKVGTREVPYLSVSNVQDRYLDLSFVKRIAATEAEIQRYGLQENDLLLTEGGDPDKLGRGTLWRGEISECIHQNHVFRVRLTSARLHPVYLNWLVGSRRGKQYFLAAAKQTTGIASINMRQLKNFPLLIPPLDLQLQFVLIVEGVSKMIERQQAGLRDIEYVTRSLGRKIFFN